MAAGSWPIVGRGIYIGLTTLTRNVDNPRYPSMRKYAASQLVPLLIPAPTVGAAIGVPRRMPAPTRTR
jgi:hypothetical protein